MDGESTGGSFSDEMFPIWNVTQRGPTGRLSVSVSNAYAPLRFVGTGKDLVNLSTVVLGDAREFQVLNSLCYPQESFWKFPSFDWLSEATYGGTADVEGVPCDLWSDDRGHRLALVSGTTRPLVYNFSLVYSFTFLTFDDGADDVHFDAKTCDDPPTCGDDFALPSDDVDVYVFHPANVLNVSGQDVADLLGEAAFLCESLDNGVVVGPLSPLVGPPASPASPVKKKKKKTTRGEETKDYEWFSKWRIAFRNRTVGQYQNCNGYPPSCLGVNTGLVGREASLAMGEPLAGQCGENRLTGSWYSLPACDDDDDDDADARTSAKKTPCPWTVVERVKTINGTCALGDDFLADHCANLRAPFLDAALALRRAFETCPPIPII